ncbi:hypothetical protein OAA60_03150 [Porticoccaceae bacterium]|nr:hypothetical protein [Porticoccaceae bacterium]
MESSMSQLSTSSLLKMYKSLSYFDTYGSSVFAMIIVSMVVLLAVSYCIVLIYSEDIIDKWDTKRCKPYVMPFAGLINKPDNMSSSEFTRQNFDFCTQRILTSTTGVALSPLTFITTTLTKIANGMSSSINSIRSMLNNVRSNLQKITQELMGRIMNMTIPLVQIIISLRDMLSKMQGAMTASLFTAMGVYMTFKTLLGAIAEFIVTILIVLAALIAGLWAVPFTWGFAAANTAIFVAISIPMAIILAFMKNIMHVNTNLKIPKVPTCFSDDTLIDVYNDISKKYEPTQMCNVVPNNLLKGGNRVTAVMKLKTPTIENNEDRLNFMYLLDESIVSGSHLIYHEDSIVLVSNHPDAIPIQYTKPYIYCLNTTHGVIKINQSTFTDWDCLTSNEINILGKIANVPKSTLLNLKSKLFDVGFDKNTMVVTNNSLVPISNICVDDIMDDGSRVYGIVYMNDNETNRTNYNLLVYSGTFTIEKDNTRIVIKDYNSCIDEKLA